MRTIYRVTTNDFFRDYVYGGARGGVQFVVGIVTEFSVMVLGTLWGWFLGSSCGVGGKCIKLLTYTSKVLVKLKVDQLSLANCLRGARRRRCRPMREGIPRSMRDGLGSPGRY